MRDGELGHVYLNGEVICKEGDKGDEMFVIQSGKVKITKKSQAGEITLATLESGNLFGEMALFDKLPRSATAVALGEARVLSIAKKKLFSTIAHDPTLVFKILETMSQRIRRLNENIAGLREARSEMMHVLCNVDETCQVILNEAKNIISADNGSIMLYDEKTGKMAISAAFGTEAAEKITFSAGEGIAGDVLKSGLAEMVNNVAIDPRYKAGDIKIHSMMCVPLKYAEKQVGVINMSLNSSDRLFTIDDLKALNSLTTYTAMVIQTAKNLCNIRNAATNVIRHATLLNM